MSDRPRDTAIDPYRLLFLGSVLAAVVGAGLFAGLYGPAYVAYFRYSPEEGDVVFQSLPRSPVVNAIEGATDSPFSHCGLVARQNGEWVVVEALHGVETTPLHEFLFRGRGQAFSVRRLKAEHRQHIAAMIENARHFLGREYDSRYQLDDDRIYCSELIYKAYLSASGERLGTLVRLGDLDWQPYQATIERIEGGPVPTDRLMITPKHLAEAEQLEGVYEFGYSP